jgi:hypothetical protein
MKTALLGVLAMAGVASVAVLTGCDTASCSYASKCPNDGVKDPVRDFNNQLLCNNRMSDSKCGGAYGDYVACFEAHQTCTSNGTTDYTITNNTCGDQYAKWTNCYYGIDGSAYDAASE